MEPFQESSQHRFRDASASVAYICGDGRKPLAGEEWPRRLKCTLRPAINSQVLMDALPCAHHRIRSYTKNIRGGVLPASCGREHKTYTQRDQQDLAGPSYHCVKTVKSYKYYEISGGKNGQRDSLWVERVQGRRTRRDKRTRVGIFGEFRREFGIRERRGNGREGWGQARPCADCSFGKAGSAAPSAFFT